MLKKLVYGLIVFVGLGFSVHLKAEENLLTSTGFDAFCSKWLNLLHEKGCYKREHVCIRKDEKNPKIIIAEYRQIRKILEKKVKKTKNTKVPYVGILKYYVEIYRSRGKTASEAVKGPFKKNDTNITTEIFYYKDGKWIY